MKRYRAPSLLKLPGLAGDLIGRDEPQPPALDMGIGAIDAAKRASPLRLQVQDPPPFEVETELRIVRTDPPRDGPLPGYGGSDGTLP